MEPINANRLEDAQALVNTLNTKKVKYVKKDSGLIERATREEKIILAEDNRQILLG